MKTIFSALDKRSAWLVWWASLLFSLIIIVVAFETTKFIYLEPFLVLPVVFASWYGSNRAGVLLALISSDVLTVSRDWLRSPNLNVEAAIYDGHLTL